MNFISNVLDSIPVVGHVKGVIHYVAGDDEGGHKAMYQATRTSVVLGAGAAGSLAGPGGAVAAAMYAGMATDGVASVAMDKPQGIIKGCQNIGDDLKMGRNPIGSIASTGFQLGMDGVGGLGMGGISSAANKVSEKAVEKTVENIAKKAVSTVGEKAIQKTVKITGEEAVKVVTKTVTGNAVKTVLKTAAVQAEVVLVSAHVTMQAKERTEEEEKENARRNREERERRAREEMEQRNREERERMAREEREQRYREELERRAREEMEQRNREEVERRTREEREQRNREEIGRRARQEVERRDREQRERRAREEREQRYREETERRARQEREQREREETQRRARQERERREQEERERRSTTGSNSQQPQENKDNNKKSEEVEPDYFEDFLNLLASIFGNEKSLTRRNICRIFENLKQPQIDYLVTIIKRLLNDGILKEVVKLVIEIFRNHFPENITFPNFLSLMEFVAVYINDEINDRILLYRMSETIARQSDRSIPKRKFEELYATVISCIMDLADIVERIVDTFARLRFDIETETTAPNTISPYFRDIFSAVYHYFKHRYVKEHGVLSVREYFDWIRHVLSKLKQYQRYNSLVEAQSSRNVRSTVVFEMFVVLFGRRIKIVIKFQGRSIVLSSCFIIDKAHKDDKEGDVWFNNEKM